MKKIFITILVVMALAITAYAAEPFFGFEGSGSTKISPEFQAWHTQFEKNGDYGESWFFLSQSDDGGVLFAMVSITNLSLGTFDGSIDLQYYGADGKKAEYHKETKRDAVKASTTEMDVTVGKAHAWGGGGSYHLTLNDGINVKLDIENAMPGYIFGDGKIKFFEDKRAEWTIGMNTIKGKASGSITANGKTYDLAGNAYHDHGWATIKLPDAVQKWFSLRLYTDKYAIVMHDQYLTKKFGSQHNKFGVFGVDNKIVGGFKNFVFTPKDNRKIKEGGYSVPSGFDVSFKVGDYEVKGSLSEKKFLGSVDILGQVSWPIRMVIKAFYSNPYMYRWQCQYELDVTDKSGATEHISGVGVVETNFF